MTTLAPSYASELVRRWARFADALEGDALDLIGTEDVVNALIDRSLLQEELDGGTELEAGDLRSLDAADRAYRRASPALLDRTDVALFKDDEPVTHWWWRIEELVLGKAADLLLNVPQAATLKGVHAHTIRLAIKEGHLPARRLARGFLVHRRDLERWQPRRVGRPRRPKAAMGDTLLEAFNEANTNGDVARAEQIAAAIEREPATPRRQLALALAAHNRGDHDDALRWSRLALGGDLPARSRQTALLVQGRALLSKNQAARARTVLRSAVGMGHIDALVHAALADAYLGLDRTGKAVEHAKQAVVEAPDVIELRYVLARMEWHDDRIANALEHVIEFRAAQPENHEGTLLYASILGVLGDRTGEDDFYRRVIDIVGLLSAHSDDAALSHGVALARLGDVEKAVDVIRGIFATSSDISAAAHACRHIIKAIVDSLDPRDPQAVAVLDEIEHIVGEAFLGPYRAWVEAVKGDVDATLTSLGTSIDDVSALGPTERETVATALVEAGRTEQARPILRSVVEVTDDAATLTRAITIALAAEDLDLAQVAMARLAERDDLSGLVADTAVRLLQVAQRAGRQQAVLSALASEWRAAEQPTSLHRMVASGTARQSSWEGHHAAFTPIVDDLMRAAPN